jgi:tetratricopeptide (TPR) repeat protein
MSTQALRLEIAEFTDANHWRWVLNDANGVFLADHTVKLDPTEPRYQTLFNLPGYLWHFAAPDTRDADERRLLRDVGAWIGASILGERIGNRILAHGAPPTIVRVLLPPAAERLLVIPLEIAHAGGQPLALQGVSLVFEVSGEAPRWSASPIGDRLRLLAVFSVPPAGSPLNLRRERQMLKALVKRLTATSGLAIELRVLQYGVTQDILLDALQHGEHWDVIHFSGHGLPGSLDLEKPDGRPDPIPAAEVSRLLRKAGQRLKLVVLSACFSAATSIEQTLSWLGESGAVRRDAATDGNPTESLQEAAPTVARALVGTLDCAVLAMRYAVEDDFAIALAEALYDGMLRQQQPLPQAAQIGLGKALGPNGTAAGALSLATPALFGAKAADLRLVPPKGPTARFAIEEIGLAQFPDEPRYFVGRVMAMTRASAALAAERSMSGVLFHGMAGGGKTSCAVELAYHHQAAERFQAFVWYRAPELKADIALSLRDLALAFEKQLPNFKMIHVIDRVDRFKAWLPGLTKMLQSNAILIVLDNLESLLTDSGHWRDERWRLLVDALLRPVGFSRAVLTSRIRPADLSDSIEVVAVHALPLDEALLLLRELPNLRSLLDGKAPDTSLAAGREMVRQTLRLVQGHPKLIELAEKLAADPQRLRAQLDRANAAGTDELDAFFREGGTRLEVEALTSALRSWTIGIAGSLPEAARLFFQFLCALEDSDREGWILERNWPDLLKRLGQPTPAPAIADALDPVAKAGLVERKATGADGDAYRVLIHPGVAEAGRIWAGTAFREAVDAELAAMWRATIAEGMNRHGKAPEGGLMIIRAGLAVFPYLSRRQEWEAASAMLEQVRLVDSSPATVAAILPQMRRIVEAVNEPREKLRSQGILAGLLWASGQPQEAETLMRAVMARAAELGELRTAGAVAGDLMALLWMSGRPDEALRIVEQEAEYNRRAAFGPWTQLANEGRRLQIFNARGQCEEVLRRVLELREQMKTLPDTAGASETISVWNVRETILGIGRKAAVELSKWQQALDLNAEIKKSNQARGAPLLERAKTLFHDQAPLLELKRYQEAGELLQYCRTIFEGENAVELLAKIFVALGNLEFLNGRATEACLLLETALRYEYAIGHPEAIAVSHFNVASSFLRLGKCTEALAHRLAATLIFRVTKSGRIDQSLLALRGDLDKSGRDALPAGFDALCQTNEQIDGVRFRDLFEDLAAGNITGDQLLAQVLAEIGAESGSA